jgi:hypothetical protein
MPNHIRLSDGSDLDVPEGTTNDQLTKMYHDAERGLLTKYTGQAAAAGHPIETGSTIYSKNWVYPNNLIGKLQAWSDHHIAPNAGSAIGSAMRIGTMAGTYVGPQGAYTIPWDLGASVANAAKKVVGGYYPSLNEYPDIPTALGTVQKLTETPSSDRPELEYSQPLWEKGAEIAPSLVAGGLPQKLKAAEDAAAIARAVIGTGAKATAGAEAGTYASKYGGDIARQTFGPNWEPVGQLAGAVTGGAAPEVGIHAINPSTFAYRNPNTGATAADVAAAAQATGVPLSTGLLSNPGGQLTERILGTAPYAGSAATSAIDEMSSGFLQAHRRLANELGSQTYPMTGADDAAIGNDLIAGSRQAYTTLDNRLQQQQNDFADKMSGAGVSVTPIVLQMREYLADPDHAIPKEQLDKLNGYINQLTGMVKGGGGYNEGWNSVNDQVPWAGVKQWRGKIHAALAKADQNGPSVDTHVLNQLYKAATDTMQNAADGVAPGLGQEFRDISTSYARAQPVLQELERVGGSFVPSQEEGRPGSFLNDGLSPGKAAMLLKAKTTRQGGTNFIDIATNNAGQGAIFPNAQWRSAAGGLISQFGQAGQQTYRPEWYGDAEHGGWDGFSDDMKAALTQDDTGAPIMTRDAAGNPISMRQQLDNLSRVAANAKTAVSRYGLTETGARTVETGASVLGLAEASHWIGVPEAVSIPVAWWGLTQGLESSPWRNALINASQGPGRSLSGATWSGVPTALDTLYGNSNIQQPDWLKSAAQIPVPTGPPPTQAQESPPAPGAAGRQIYVHGNAPVGPAPDSANVASQIFTPPTLNPLSSNLYGGQ